MVVIDRIALAYLSELPEKSHRLVKERCHALAENPWPSPGSRALALTARLWLRKASPRTIMHLGSARDICVCRLP